MKKISILSGALSLGFALGLSGAAAQSTDRPVGTDPARQPNASQVKSGVEGADRVLSRAAQNAGVRACQPLVDRATRYLISDSPSWGLLLAAPDNANSRIFSTVIEIEPEKGPTTIASATFAPYGDSACGVSYDAVTYWKESCLEVYSKQLKELRLIGNLGNKVVMLDGGPSMRIFLMPAGTGCVQIKKETAY